MWRRASGELVRGSSAVGIHSGVVPDIVCFVRASAALSVMVREIAGGPFAEDENAVEALAPGRADESLGDRISWVVPGA